MQHRQFICIFFMICICLYLFGQYLKLIIFFSLASFAYFCFLSFCFDPFYLPRDAPKALDNHWLKNVHDAEVSAFDIIVFLG